MIKNKENRPKSTFNGAILILDAIYKLGVETPTIIIPLKRFKYDPRSRDN